jgi:hypothetical protein
MKWTALWPHIKLWITLIGIGGMVALVQGIRTMWRWYTERIDDKILIFLREKAPVNWTQHRGHYRRQIPQSMSQIAVATGLSIQKVEKGLHRLEKKREIFQSGQEWKIADL